MNLLDILGLVAFFCQQAEEYLGSGTGDEKKKVVIEVITKLIATLKINVPAIIMQNISTIIDILVFFFNAVKAFKKA